MSNKILLFFYSLSILVLFSCEEQLQHPPTSFYYWKQNYQLDSVQKILLKKVGTKKLYLKFFDLILDANQNPVPISKIKFTSKMEYELVPCVFVKNEVFKEKIDLKILAEKVNQLIISIAKRNSLNYREIQIDCDWSSKTKSQYFKFLEHLTDLQKEEKLITCTIRLHQIKYPEKTGVPPVKKGLLMCYNMDDIDKIETPNSIINPLVLKQYIQPESDYPMQLDLALPIFQWGLVYRLGKLSIIINDICRKELLENKIKPINKNYFLVNENCYSNGVKLFKGDLIKLESSNADDLIKIAKYFKDSQLNFHQLIYFHISQNHLNEYDEKFFTEINSIVP